MQKRIVVVIVGISLLCAAVGSRGQMPAQSAPTEPEMPLPVPAEQKLTLAQALALAERQNPLIAASGHQIAGARANLSGQRAPLNLQLNVTAVTSSPDTFDPTDPTRYGVLLPLEISGRQRIRTHQARAQLQGVTADAETTRLNVRQAVAAAYADLQVANLALENERTAYQTAQRLNDLTEKRVQSGDAAESNAIRTRIALTQEEQNLLKAVNTVQLARSDLNVQIGRAPETLVDASDPLTFTPISVQLEALQQEAAQWRPELRSAEANRRALQANVSLQRSQYIPDLIFGVDPRAAEHGQVQFAIAMPLFDFGSIRGQIRKAQEDVKVQDAQTEQIRQIVRRDVEAAYLALTQAQRLVTSFQDGILPRAESLLQRVEQGYSLGASSILDVIDAQQTYRSTRQDYDQALGDYRRAQAQLERAVGHPLPQVPK